MGVWDPRPWSRGDASLKNPGAPFGVDMQSGIGGWVEVAFGIWRVHARVMFDGRRDKGVVIL
jgi:hypothetical protein